MATLKLTVFKAKVLKDGRHKIRIAVCHKQETCYIITNVIIDSESQWGITNILYKSNFKVIPPTNNFFYVIIVFVYFLLFLLFCILYQPLLVKA